MDFLISLRLCGSQKQHKVDSNTSQKQHRIDNNISQKQHKVDSNTLCKTFKPISKPINIKSSKALVSSDIINDNYTLLIQNSCPLMNDISLEENMQENIAVKTSHSNNELGNVNQLSISPEEMLLNENRKASISFSNSELYNIDPVTKPYRNRSGTDGQLHQGKFKKRDTPAINIARGVGLRSRNTGIAMQGEIC